MKKIFLVLCFFFSLSSNAQTNLFGHYTSTSGQITINPDSTFKYSWHVCLQAKWAFGTWRFFKDTLYLTMTPVYDTLRYFDKNRNITRDTLVLKEDEETGQSKVIINQIDWQKTILTRYIQEEGCYPSKLFYKKGRLYNFRNGKLLTKRIKHWNNKKYPSWYYKLKE